MSSSITVNGNTYIWPDMFLNYQYVQTWPTFITDCIAQFITYLSSASASAVAAAASASTAANSAATQGTSTTSLTIGTGSQSLTIQTGKGLLPGMPIRIAKNDGSLNWMDGSVTSYNSSTGALVAAVQSITGSGTYAAWNVFLEGPIAGLSHGQCRLSLSGANLVLKPFNGNQLIINGAAQTIPAAGISLAPTGLGSGILFYIYAYMVGSVMTLVANTNTHVTDATTGVEVMSGYSAYTLVGAAVCPTVGTFADTASQRYVLSYFNRTMKNAVTAGSAVTASTSVVTLTNFLYFICWGDEDITAGCTGSVYLSSSGIITSGYEMDSNSTLADTTYVSSASANLWGNFSTCTKQYRLSEANHYCVGIGGTNAGTGNWTFDTLTVGIKG